MRHFYDIYAIKMRESCEVRTVPTMNTRGVTSTQ